MPIYLDHTIVPAHDKEESARFFARIFGLEYKGPWGHFAPVKVNETLSMDFDNRTGFERHHYAFLVSDPEFDAILGRVQAEGVAYGSAPASQDDGQINHKHQGRGFYFRDPNGHSWEVITHTYV
jgi:catechol 2,3-dioxygenase-like lactoylglutathione lyase family enzyme